MIKIAVVTPTHRDDFYINTVLDGLGWLVDEGADIEFRFPDYYPHPYGSAFTARYGISEDALREYAKKADLIILSYGKYGINFSFVDEINGWSKTVYVDGSELGKDRWRDPNIQRRVLDGTYEEQGRIDVEMLRKCRLYFRREKPYVTGTIPFTLAVERRHMQYFDPAKPKDIDFFAVFGQEEYSIMRKHTRELTEQFCNENGFTCHTAKTRILPFIQRGPFSQDKFYKMLARSKVGVSVGGAGFDTLRFWEILGNNCIILTEHIDLYPTDSNPFPYERVWEFNNLHDFFYQLERLGEFLRTAYDQKNMLSEFRDILKRHSSKARAELILTEAHKKGVIGAV